MTVKRHISMLVPSSLIVMIALACADYGGPPTAPGPTVDTVSFAAEIQDTLIARCAQPFCHGLGFGMGGFTMGNVTWSEIRNGAGLQGAVIVPGNADLSILYLKTTPTPPFGFRMPNDRTILSLEAQTAIRDWINQGALDN